MYFQTASFLFAVASAVPTYGTTPIVVVKPVYVAPVVVVPSTTAIGSNFNQYQNTQSAGSNQYSYANTGASNYNILLTPLSSSSAVNAVGTNYLATSNQNSNSQSSGIDASQYANTASPSGISNAGQVFSVSQSSGGNNAAAQVTNGNYGVQSVITNDPNTATQNVQKYANTNQAGSNSGSMFNQGAISASNYNNFMNGAVNSQTGSTTGSNYGFGGASSAAYSGIDASTSAISATQNGYKLVAPTK